MQQIANENNLSETAFLVPCRDVFEIRWFTPVGEVDLCGHATLASAYVLLHYKYQDHGPAIFNSASGELRAEERDHYLEIALRHSESLGSLVSELFELARLEAREIRPSPEPFAAGDLVQDVVQKFQLEADRRRLRLRAEASTREAADRLFAERYTAAVEGVDANDLLYQVESSCSF